LELRNRRVVPGLTGRKGHIPIAIKVNLSATDRKKLEKHVLDDRGRDEIKAEKYFENLRPRKARNSQSSKNEG